MNFHRRLPTLIAASIALASGLAHAETYEFRKTVTGLSQTMVEQASCKSILDSGAAVGDGIYTINPSDSGSLEVYCDMTTDGGGWTQVMGPSISSALLTFSDLGASSVDYVTSNSVKIKQIQCDGATHGVAVESVREEIPHTHFRASLSWVGHGLGDQCQNVNVSTSADGVFFDGGRQTYNSAASFSGQSVNGISFQCSCTGNNNQSGTASGEVWVR